MAITPINVTTSNTTGTVVLSAVGLPSGLTFTDNTDGTGDITGTVAQGEALNSPFTVTITATDDVATDDETFQMTVEPPALKPNVGGLADINSVSRVLDNFDLTTLTTNITASPGPMVEVGHNLLAFGTETTTGADSLAIIDVSTPSSPTLVSETASLFSTSAGTRLLTVDVANQILYAYDDGDFTLRGIDISTPATPTLVHGPLSAAGGQAIYFSGAYVLSAAYLSGLNPTFDIANADLTSLLYDGDLSFAFDQTSTDRVSMAGRGNFVWLTAGSGVSGDGLTLIDITNPGSPTVSANFNIDGNDAPGSVFLPGTASGDVVVGGMEGDGFEQYVYVYPATGAEDGTEPSIANVIGTPPGRNFNLIANSMIADLNLVVYQAAQSAGIDVIDASAPASAFVVDNTLASSHDIDEVYLTDDKVIGKSQFGNISIWV